MYTCVYMSITVVIHVMTSPFSYEISGYVDRHLSHSIETNIT